MENIYETDELVQQYCDFQYGENCLGIENFAKVCAQKAIHYASDVPHHRAMDLGCATGRASFELARSYDQVIGIDYSQAFIDVASEVQRHGEIGYYQNGEGELKIPKTASLDALGLKQNQEKVVFYQGDACALSPEHKEFDLVMATNLIDRLYHPALFLDSIGERIKSGGYLILTSPYTWMETYTPKSEWIGGYVDASGQEVKTLEGLKTRLLAVFDLIATEDVPFVIRETPRKHQYTIAELSVWKKRG